MIVAVSPEALGLAEHVSSIVADMNRNRGITAGGMQLLMLLSGARQKRRKSLLQVGALYKLFWSVPSGINASQTQLKLLPYTVLCPLQLPVGLRGASHSDHCMLCCFT